MAHDGHDHDDHDHSHDHGHDHAHSHSHDHGHSHAHAPTAAHDHAHSHVHAPSHDPVHSHGHSHSHGGPSSSRLRAASPWRADLPRAAGHGKILFLDAPAGLAGDMIIAALVDLGVPGAVIAEAAAAIPVSGFQVHFGTRVRSGIVASHFDVKLETAQPERTYADVRKLLDAARISPEVRERAHATFKRLAESEAKVHRMPLDDVHFHEVGAIDALVDVVGSAAALEYLGAELVVSPLPMGRGFVKARHGLLPLPPPAVVECLTGFPTYDAGTDFEFVTPTGAAIVAAHAKRALRWPSMSPEHVGWGSGTADLADRPNLLRAILGTPDPSADAGESDATHTVIEANLDDATGEVVAIAIEALFAAGAVDAWATPATMKKGRPALVVSALAPNARADAVAHAMLRETTSLGIRRYRVGRIERPRRFIEVETPFGRIPVKIGEGPYGPPQIKPELDACVVAARAYNVPVREVIRAAILASGTQR